MSFPDDLRTPVLDALILAIIFGVGLSMIIHYIEVLPDNTRNWVTEIAGFTNTTVIGKIYFYALIFYCVSNIFYNRMFGYNRQIYRWSFALMILIIFWMQYR